MDKYILILAVAALSVSCSKDDKKGASLVGQWSYSKVDTTDDGVENFVDYVQNDASCSKDNYNFKATGNYQDISYLSDTNPCDPYLDAGTWSKSGTNLYFLSDSFGAFNAEILVLTATELKLKWPNGTATIFVRQ